MGFRSYELNENAYVTDSNPPIVSRTNKLAYAAGIIDGEGCVGVYWNKVHKNYQLRVQVQMCEAGALEVLTELFGGLLYYIKRKSPRRPIYSWVCLSSKAESMLREILPYLLVKRRQAEVALRGDWSSFNKNKPLTKGERKRRGSISASLTKLNRRGV